MVRFISETTGWVIGENFVYKTTDGGMNWVTQDSVMGGGCEALYGFDSLIAIYSDYGNRGIRRTTDGGLTWYTADDQDYNYLDFKFINQNRGFACGSTNSYDSLVVRRTTDGGENWNTITSTYAADNYDFEGISFIDSLDMDGQLLIRDGFIILLMADLIGILRTVLDILILPIFPVVIFNLHHRIVVGLLEV